MFMGRESRKLRPPPRSQLIAQASQKLQSSKLRSLPARKSDQQLCRTPCRQKVFSPTDRFKEQRRKYLGRCYKLKMSGEKTTLCHQILTAFTRAKIGQGTGCTGQMLRDGTGVSYTCRYDRRRGP